MVLFKPNSWGVNHGIWSWKLSYYCHRQQVQLQEGDLSLAIMYKGRMRPGVTATGLSWLGVGFHRVEAHTMYAESSFNVCCKNFCCYLKLPERVCYTLLMFLLMQCNKAILAETKTICAIPEEIWKLWNLVSPTICTLSTLLRSRHEFI